MGVAFVLLIAVGRMVDPRSSVASGPIHEPGAVAVTPGKPLGSLAGRSYTVSIESVAGEARYTVINSRGVLEASGLTALELASRYPDLDITTSEADRPALMLADPADHP